MKARRRLPRRVDVQIDTDGPFQDALDAAFVKMPTLIAYAEKWGIEYKGATEEELTKTLSKAAAAKSGNRVVRQARAVKAGWIPQMKGRQVGSEFNKENLNP